MEHHLVFALYGRRAGTIERDGGRLTLAYDPAYLADPGATPLSLSLPLIDEPHPTRSVEAYLRGLLPDSAAVRQRWAATFDLRDRDTFGLIAAIGLDCAGAAVFALPEEFEAALGRVGDVVALTEREIGQHLRRLRADDTAWHDEDGDHWSLAGGQSKFTLARLGDGWGRPIGSEPSTHIVKPGSGRIAGHALTEHISTRALSILGERVARTSYIEFDGEPALVVERFDRLRDLVGRVQRVHSEDLLQSFGLDPSRKYEADGGPGIARITARLAAVADDAAVDRFLRAIIANYLLAAPDAHAKNYSVLLAQRQVTLAPLYDVASGLASDPVGRLRYRRMAMAIGGENRFGEVESRHWAKLARLVGRDPDEIRGIVADLAARLPDAVDQAIGELPLAIQGRAILTDQVLPRVARLAEHTAAGLTTSTRTGGRVVRPYLDELEEVGKVGSVVAG